MGYFFRKNPEDKRGKWSDVLKSLMIVIVLFMGFRWILFEPFVIPSGSMEQTLLVQDYVVVKKWAYGLRVPFTKTWILGPETPNRGDIVVFKAKNESGHFLVKRVIGLPGDRITINQKGRLSVNGVPFSYKELDSENDSLRVFLENNGDKSYRVQWLANHQQSYQDYSVPEGHIFMMGDNRNFSSDSRYWGALPVEQIIGQLTFIWMSCEESESHSSFLCPPAAFRKERLFKSVQ